MITYRKQKEKYYNFKYLLDGKEDGAYLREGESWGIVNDQDMKEIDLGTFAPLINEEANLRGHDTLNKDYI